ncbi:hypothetical protein [Roseitranquillus sediminis]|uniref:hypothetical protein n=1 Tax=Roseitranquillus sediminis TaxID=2809051 RepID=UPI001D0C344F|nr:hypothetical protein [Roseitranquillus sediminis]MBM9595544.1 hypothetical protein [Roseitranquillus sediminis]
MPDETVESKRAGKEKGAKAKGAAPETAAAPLKPKDSELRFQHVIRNMVAARDEAKGRR